MRISTLVFSAFLLAGLSQNALADDDSTATKPVVKAGKAATSTAVKKADAKTTAKPAATATATSASPAVSQTPPPPPPATGTKINVKAVTDAPLPGDFVMGKKKAPLIMIEYASMSCPHCAHFSNTVMPDIEKKYIDTGKVRYILRQFPLNEPALKAADLLQCIGEKDNDKYFVFARVLFDAQGKWAYDGNYMSGLETFATVGGMSKDEFSKCMADKANEDKVLAVKKVGNDDVKVPHTPFIIIGGEVYENGNTADKISEFIDEKLAKKK